MKIKGFIDDVSFSTIQKKQQNKGNWHKSDAQSALCCLHGKGGVCREDGECVSGNVFHGIGEG